MPEGTRVADCVEQVKAKGGGNPYTVCQSATGQSYATGKKIKKKKKKPKGVATMSKGSTEVDLFGEHERRLAAVAEEHKLKANPESYGDTLPAVPSIRDSMLTDPGLAAKFHKKMAQLHTKAAKIHKSASTFCMDDKKKPEQAALSAAHKAAAKFHRGKRKELKKKAQFSANPPVDPATIFAATFSVEDKTSPSPLAGHVRRKAEVLFRAGNYPDKNISLTPAEISDAVKDFKGVNIGLEHVPTVLNGKLGQLSVVGSTPDGVMFGEADIPEWLDKTLKPEERKLSMSWDRKTKRVIGCDFVRFPRITDAALVAGFSAVEPTVLDKIKFKKKGVAKFADGSELSMNPNMADGDDIPSKVCALIDGELRNANPRVLNPKYIQALTKIRELASGFKAGNQVVGANGGRDDAGYVKANQEDATMTSSSTTAFSDEAAKKIAELEAEKKQLQEKLNAGALSARKTEAAAFADSLVNRKIFPTERDGVADQYLQAMTDDADKPAMFSDGKTRVQRLKDTFAARPDIRLTGESGQQSAQQVQVVSSDFSRTKGTEEGPTDAHLHSEPKKMSKDRKAHLLKKTRIGVMAMSLGENPAGVSTHKGGMNPERL